MTDVAPSLTVAVLTYRRPAELLRCLAAVLDQVDAALAHGAVSRARTLVIDNDPEGSAREVVTSLASERVRYVHETEPGIAAARNRALREADSRLLEFIDDDEIPRPGWLSALLTTWRATGAQAVMGRVESVIEGPPHPWLREVDLFGRPRAVTGTVIPEAATGNLLLDLAWVHDHRITFDQRLGLGAGEDSVFTRQMVRAGATIVWCDESVADDPVPASRTTPRWLMRRFFSHGTATTMVGVLLSESPAAATRARARGLIQGTLRLIGGTARYLLGVLTNSSRQRTLGVRALGRGAGMIWAAAGRTFHEYARPPEAPGAGRR